MVDRVKILGISFFNGHVNSLISQLKEGGLLVVPSGPGLATIETEKHYYKSLLAAEYAIADSGYMALIWNLFHKQKVKRISGLKFLNSFFSNKEIKAINSFFLINPNLIEGQANVMLMNRLGFSLANDSCYNAPYYNEKIDDPTLINILKRLKPRFILINIGGGVQERLGAYLRERLDYRPALICTGAAIAFLTGHQANIPNWGDKIYLGWLFRCFQNPTLYVPRYLQALKLVFIILKYGKNGPII